MVSGKLLRSRNTDQQVQLEVELAILIQQIKAKEEKL